MSAPPIPCMWTGHAFEPLKRAHNIAASHYGEGEVVSLVPHEDRSLASHGHYFAVLNAAFQSLPEAMAERFPTVEALRKWALIKAGYRDERSIVCASKAEAQRVAAFVKPMDGYAVVTARDALVTVYTAKSQSMRAMGKADFQASKDAVLEVVAGLLDVTPATLARQAA